MQQYMRVNLREFVVVVPYNLCADLAVEAAPQWFVNWNNTIFVPRLENIEARLEGIDARLFQSYR